MPFRESEFEKPKTGAEVGPEEEKPEEEKPTEGQPEEEAAKQPEKPEGTAEESAEKKELTKAEIYKRWNDRLISLSAVRKEIEEAFGFSFYAVEKARKEGGIEPFEERDIIIARIEDKEKEIQNEYEEAMAELKRKEDEELAELKRKRQEEAAKKLESI